MTSTLTKAVIGRRVGFTYYRDLKRPDRPEHLGIVTALKLNQGGVLNIRLDGQRTSLHIPAYYQGLRYLDEVVPVPDLPMGRFTPVADDLNGFYERAGVLVAAIGEDGEALIILTGDRDKAFAAASAYGEEIGYDPDYVALEHLESCWAVFEWLPEDSEFPWVVRWPTPESEEQAIHIHYLPA